MKRLFTIVMGFLTTLTLFGDPISGTFSIPGPEYPTIRQAIVAINANGIGTGGVIFNVTENYTETFLSPTDGIITATGTATDPIIFQKNGPGANPKIIAAPNGTTTTLDGIIKLAGTDYITFDGIDLAENDLNTTPTPQMEWGYALVKKQATGSINGCQYVTIKNCKISLNKSNTATVGIYSGCHIATAITGLTVASTADAMNNCKFYNDSITNAYTAIKLTGYAATTPFTFYDQNNEIGQLGENVITNFGGGTAAAYGIYTIYQNNLIVGNNKINGGTGTTGIVYGIYLYTATSANLDLHHNTVTVTSSAISSTALYGIYTAMGSTPASNTVNISNNIVQNCTYPTAVSGTFYGCYNTGTAANINIYNNLVTNNTIPGTGTNYLLYTSGATGVTTNCYNNEVSGNTKNGTGTMYCLSLSTAVTTAHHNNIFNNTVNTTGTSAGTIYGLYNNGSPTFETYYNNDVYGLNVAGSSTSTACNIYGLYTNSIATGVKDIRDNTIHDCSINTPGSGTINGLHNTTGATVNIYRNRVYGMSVSGAAALVNGFTIASGTTVNAYNNFISDLKAPSGTGTDAVRGINITSTAAIAVNLYYNTVFLNASSTSATTFGTAGIYKAQSGSSATCDFRNNLIVNVSTPGPTGGFTVAHRWSAAFSGASYATTSNNNNFYAGVPAMNRRIFYDGTNYDTLMTQYQARVVPRDGNSFSENSPFMQIVTPPYNLHLRTGVITPCESGGIPINTPFVLTKDFDNDNRYPMAPYPEDPDHLATNPDVGADEFGGIPTFSCVYPPVPGNTTASATLICNGQSVTLGIQNNLTGTGYNFQWQTSTNDTTYNNITGANSPMVIVTPISTLYYRCEVICQNGPTPSYSTPIQVGYTNAITSTTSASRCGLGTVQLAAASSGGTIKWYASAYGGVPLGTGSPWTTPEVDTTTTFYVGSESNSIGEANVGAGATTSATYSNPFYSLYSNLHSQILIRAADLYAAGILPGNFTTLGLEVTSAGTLPMIDLSIKMAHTDSTSMANFASAAFTTVFTSASYMPTNGINTLTLTTPFNWDGVSNVILEFCHGNPSSTATMSRTVKADNIPYVCCIKTHATSSTGSSTICGNTTSNKTTYSVRPKFTINGAIVCSTPRQGVKALVSPPPPLSITSSRTVCNGAITQVSVTSDPANYDTYIWTPKTNLYKDAAATIPYDSTSAATLYFMSATAGSYNYFVRATNLTSLCADTVKRTYIVMPASSSVNASPPAICISGTTTLRLTPATGYGNAQFQWQSSSDSLNWANEPGGTSASYTTPVLTATTFYRVLIKNSSGDLCSPPGCKVIVNDPHLITTIPGTRCGAGIVTLEATGANGTLSWYDSPTSSTILGTGSPFITPYINATTTYYVSCNGAGATQSNVPTPNVGTSLFWTATAGWGLRFTVNSPVTINSVRMYPSNSTAGDATLQVKVTDLADVVIYSGPVYNFTVGTTISEQIVPVNINISVPGNYKMVMTSTGINNLVRESSGVTFPYTAPNGELAITAGANGSGTAQTTSAYYWFYSWVISTGCNSARVPVVATVIPAIPVLLNTPVTLCNDGIGTLGVTSSLSDYTSYVWSPATNLFTDAAATVPYDGVSSKTTIYTRTTTPGQFTYTCTAFNSVDQCQDTALTTVTTLPVTADITASPDILCVSGSTTLELNVPTGLGQATFQWQFSSDNISWNDCDNATLSTYTTPDITTSTYYRVMIRNTNAIVCLSPQIKVDVDNPLVTETISGTRCGMGTVTLGATGEGGTLSWYAAPTGGAALGTGPVFVTPVISNSTNYYVGCANLHAAGMDTVGVGATTSATYSNPFYSLWSNLHSQILIRAEDLIASGIVPGTLTSLGLDVTSAGTLPMIDLSVKLALTDSMSMANFATADFTTVFTSPSYMPTLGINTLEFTAPFIWDGVSNVVMEFCHGNAGSTATMSRTVKADNTSYVSCVKTHISAATGAAVICANTTTNKLTYTVRPQMYINYISVCASPRSEVHAIVNTPPELTINGTQTICGNTIASVAVTSNPDNYDTFIWTPATNLYTDAAATIPYDGLSSALTLYAKSTEAETITYTCTGDSAGICVTTATMSITFLPVNPTISAFPPSICISGTTTMSLTPLTGYGTGTLQWQESPDSLTWGDLAGSTSSTCLTETLTATSYYRVLIKNSSGSVCSTPGIKIGVYDPKLTSTTGGSRCGTGTVTLYAEGSGGTITWYDGPNSGTIVGTGSPFITPMISTTTTYYVSAKSSGITFANVGMATSSNGTSGSGATTYGLYFDAISPFTLKSVNVYPNASANNTPGTVTISVIDGTGAVLNQATVNVTGFVQSTTPTFQTVDLNFNILPGNGLRLVMTSKSSGISGLMFQPTAGGPYPFPYTIPGVVSITSGTYGGTVYPSLYYYFYNWLVSVPCETPKTAVIATVTPAVPVLVNGPFTVCNDQISQIAVTSALENYDNYVWSPVTGLYTNAAATIPYDGVTNTSTIYARSTTAGTTTYVCIANNSFSLCQDTAQVRVAVLPSIPVVTSHPDTICVSGSSTLTLNTSTGFGSATYQWQSSSDGVTFSDITGATSTTYTTPTITITTSYRVLVKNGLGSICTFGSKDIIVSNPMIVNTTPGSRCGTGTVVLGATPGGGGSLKWYATQTGGMPIGTGSPFTTPVIATTSTFYVSSVAGSGAIASVGPATNSIGAGGAVAYSYYQIFDVMSNMTLEGVYVYPGAAGNVVFYIATNTGGIMTEITYPVSSASIGLKTYIPVNLTMAPGTGYRIGWETPGVSMYRNTAGATYPYTLPGVISITGNSFSGYPEYFYYFYDWKVSTYCESARSPVVATVTPAPSITAEATPASICPGLSTTLNVTGQDPAYEYTWEPGNLSGATQVVTPTVSTVYTVTAANSITQCNNVATVPVEVKTAPTDLIVYPDTVTMDGTLHQLTANGGTLGGSYLFGLGTNTNTTTGYPAPYSNYYGGTKHQILIRASELLAAGITPGSPINSVAFNVSAVGSTFTGSLTSFQIRMKNTTSSVLTSSSFETEMTLVYGPQTQAIPTTGLPTQVVHNITPFTWDGTNNLVIETSYSNGNTGTSTDFVQMRNSDPGFVSTNWYRVDGQNAAYVLAATAPTSSGNARPNMVLGVSGSTEITWFPIEGLYSDMSGTIPYAGEATPVVFANPSVQVTYTATAMGDNGCSKSGTSVFIGNAKTLYVKAFLEGFYDITTGQLNKAQDVNPDDFTQFDKFSDNHADSISVLLVSDLGPVWPDPIPYEYKGIGKFINMDGIIAMNDIPGTMTGDYYIIVKHRQTVETWSASPVSFAGSIVTYDFTTAASQAFGNNQKQVDEGIYGLWGGDVTSMFGPQDGYVDIFDNNDIFNLSQLAAFGYIVEDLTGFAPAGGVGPDGFVDIFDMALVFNNMQLAIGMNTPPFPLKKSTLKSTTRTPR